MFCPQDYTPPAQPLFCSLVDTLHSVGVKTLIGSWHAHAHLPGDLPLCPQTGYDSDDAKPFQPRVRKLTGYGKSWLAAFEQSSKQRRRLLRVRSQGGVAQHVFLFLFFCIGCSHRSAGKTRKKFRSGVSPVGIFLTDLLLFI